ncbi:MAG TPA: AlpA family phage regulatory protein [Pseudorhizobium sp.]|jgi:hypothetical protein|nr:AlpA family phage regulatory protein [Pseudorhizobium sp.]
MAHSIATHSEDLPPNELPRTGFVRLAGILAPNGPIPVSRSTWWAGVRTGRFPQPVKLGPRTTVWRWSEIRAMVEGDN